MSRRSHDRCTSVHAPRSPHNRILGHRPLSETLPDFHLYMVRSFHPESNPALQATSAAMLVCCSRPDSTGSPLCAIRWRTRVAFLCKMGHTMKFRGRLPVDNFPPLLCVEHQPELKSHRHTMDHTIPIRRKRCYVQIYPFHSRDCRRLEDYFRRYPLPEEAQLVSLLVALRQSALNTLWYRFPQLQ